MNKFVSIVVLCVTAMLSAGQAAADSGKKLTIIVGQPAGGVPDLAARALGHSLKAEGYDAVIENKTGAGGRIAIDALLKAPADGSTIMVVPSGTLTIYPLIYKNIRYSLDDFVVLGAISDMKFGFAVTASVPAKNLKEFMALSKSNQEIVQFGSPGAGSSLHFLGVQLGTLGGVNFQHIPYKGSMPAITDAIGGTIKGVMATIPSLVGPQKYGKLKILAQSGETRSASIPDVPTFKESGFPSLTTGELLVVVAKVKTSPSTTKSLVDAVEKSANSSNFKSMLLSSEIEPIAMGTEASDTLQKVRQRWTEVIRATGFKAED